MPRVRAQDPQTGGCAAREGEVKERKIKNVLESTVDDVDSELEQLSGNRQESSKV